MNNHGHLTVHCVEFSGIGQRGGEELGVGGEEVSGWWALGWGRRASARVISQLRDATQSYTVNL